MPKAHYKVAKSALEHNKHVYSEKPMAINLSDGKKLLKIANKKITENLQICILK